MKTIIYISRLFAGLVFVFSGFVKAIDPAGSAIKFEEYFVAFHLDFLIVTALPLAIILSAAEMMIGLNLIVGLRLKFTTWLLMIFVSFFTILTLVLALTNPVSDCGCFGDALKLTNWQTFGKNIILLIPTVLLFVNRNKFRELHTSVFGWLLSGVNFIIPVLISIYCIVHQPIIDFRPYTTGTYIPDKMNVPEGAPVDVYETTLVYEKNGLKQEFSESNFPWQDTTWKWVETKLKLISRGFEPLIHDFAITGIEGTDITDSILKEDNYVLLIIAPKLEHADNKGMKLMNELSLKAGNLGFTTYCLTSSTNDQINAFNNNFQPAFDIVTADETTLKTIIRANPGLMILQNGTILGKWNYNDMPDINSLKPNLVSYVLDRQSKSSEKASVFIIAFSILVFYSLITRFNKIEKTAGN